MSSEISEQTKVLKEILKWIKLVGMKEAKNVLNSVLSDDAKRIVYHYSDGTRGTQDFKNIANIKSSETISRYWKEWYKIGIVEMINVRGGKRAKKSFELEDFGISIPNIPEPSKKEEVPVEMPIEEAKENGFRGNDTGIKENKQ